MTVDNVVPPDASRRRLLGLGGSAVVAALLPTLALSADSATLPSPAPLGPYVLPDLPYAESALEPKVSTETLSLHHGKHHRGYVDKLNSLLVGDSRSGKSLAELMRSTHGRTADAAIFNNAAQAWNHSFYWKSLTPSGGGGVPGGALAAAIDRDFGGFGSFRSRLADAANSQFGSGWAWLVLRDGKISVEKTGDADNPILTGAKPLLTIDVWEHAYYVDYRNRRADYVASVIDGLLNWKFAEDRLGSA